MAQRKQRIAMYPSEVHKLMYYLIDHVDDLYPGKGIFDRYLRMEGTVNRDPKVLWQWACREIPRMPAAPPGQFTEEDLAKVAAKLNLKRV